MKKYKVFFDLDVFGRFISSWTFKYAASKQNAENEVRSGLEANYPFAKIIGLAAFHWN